MDNVPAINLLHFIHVYAQYHRVQAQQRTKSKQDETTIAQKY